VRFGESPVVTMGDLSLAVATAMKSLLDVPVAVFGHSLGARVAFEVAKRLGTRVGHVFVSACPAPDLTVRNPRADLEDDALLVELEGLGATPPGVLADRELLDLLLPIIRADLVLAETYRASATQPIDVPVTAFAGKEDTDVPVVDVGEWRRFTRKEFRLQEMEGNHMFLETARARLHASMRLVLAGLD